MKKLPSKQYNRLVAQSCSESNAQVGKSDRKSADEILKAKLKSLKRKS